MKAHRAPKAKEVLEKFYCWYDYSQLIELIVMKLRYDAENYREYGHNVDSYVEAEQMVKCANYLENSSEDMNYVNYVEDNEEYTIEEIWEKQSADLEYALNIIKKNLYNWWD